MKTESHAPSAGQLSPEEQRLMYGWKSISSRFEKAKAAFVSADIWIDDSPQWVYQDSL